MHMAKSCLFTDFCIDYWERYDDPLFGKYRWPALLDCTGDPLCWIVHVTRFVGLHRWPDLLDCTGDTLCWIAQVTHFVGLYRWPDLLDCIGDPLCWIVPVTPLFWIVQVTRFVGLYRWHTLLDCTSDPLCWIVQEACCTCTTRPWRALIGWCGTWLTVTTATCVSPASSASSFTSSKPRPQILVSARTVVGILALLVSEQYWLSFNNASVLSRCFDLFTIAPHFPRSGCQCLADTHSFKCILQPTL